MLLRERCPVSARALIPSPAPLPRLQDALRRRASTFGPYDGDEPRIAPGGLLARLGAALRGVADLLDPPAVLS